MIQECYFISTKKQLLNQQVETTTEKLKTLRISLWPGGENSLIGVILGEQQWRRFQREVVAAETGCKHFNVRLQLTEIVKGTWCENG